MRIVTVHPALVHFTIGALPILVIAYGLAAMLRSERWTFAGDVTLVIAAALTVAVMAFGLVSNALLRWPGGVGTWRFLHLGFGIGTTVVFVLFALTRLARRRRHPVATAATLSAAVALSLIAGFTGWIGGEVLVYRAGIAVKAGGDGALAPVGLGLNAPAPAGIMPAMHRARASWAAASAELAQIIVDRPTAERYRRIGVDAANLRRVAAWMAGGMKLSANMPAQKKAVFRHMAQELEEHAAAVEAAARAGDLPGVASGLGAAAEECSHCHEQLRWKHAR